MSTKPSLSAVSPAAAAGKRKDVPREDEDDDDSGSDAGSDVVIPSPYMSRTQC